MNTGFTLLLAARAAILLQHFGAAPERAWLLPYEGPELQSALAEALTARPDAPVTVYLDLETEDMRVDALPPAAFWQREGLMERQRGFHFPEAAFSGSRHFREKGSRGGNVLHAGAAAPDVIQKTLAGLTYIANSVEPLGFYAIEAQPVLEGLIKAPADRLMLLLGEATGLRQCVIRGGLPVLTRLHVECAPSLPEETLVPMLLQHVQSTRDYLPRLSMAADIPVQLFAGPALKPLADHPEFQRAGIELIALEPPGTGLVPPEWELDLAILARLAVTDRRRLPLAPDWLKGRRRRLTLREDVSIIMFVFGCAGMAFGVQTLLSVPPAPPVSAPAPVQPSPPPPAAVAIAPPDLKLDAVMLNAPNDWAVWINGTKYTPETGGGPLKILSVTPEGVTVEWHKDGQTGQAALSMDEAARGLPEKGWLGTEEAPAGTPAGAAAPGAIPEGTPSAPQ